MHDRPNDHILAFWRILDRALLGKHLGQMVLEKEYKEFVVLAPQIYEGFFYNDNEITKVKGFKILYLLII